MRSLTVVLALAALAGCQRRQSPPPSPASPATPVMAAPGDAPKSEGLVGKLLERIDAPPYSYLRIQTRGGEVWAAVPETKIEKGAEVTVSNPMQMDNFESKTLKRKFAVVFFGTLDAPSNPAGASMQHATAAKGPADAPDVRVDKAAGAEARTVAEIHAQKDSLKEKSVTLHAKVVKVTSEVLSKNWLHLRDGTGNADKGDNDITVTTTGTAKVGDVLLIKGTVRVNKDFGAGYTYKVLIEDAKILN